MRGKVGLTAVLIVAGIGVGWAQSARQTMGYEALTVAGTAVGITSTVYVNALGQRATQCMATLETAQIRFRTDGTAPTASEGHLLEVGDQLILDGIGNITQFRAIRTGGTSGTLRVSCLR